MWEWGSKGRDHSTDSAAEKMKAVEARDCAIVVEEDVWQYQV